MTEPTTEQLIAVGYTTTLREYAAEQHLLEQWRHGPALVWLLKGDYLACSACHERRPPDWPHSWQECNEVLRIESEVLSKEVAELTRQRDGRSTDDQIRWWLSTLVDKSYDSIYEGIRSGAYREWHNDQR